jgi:gluconokinase
MVARQSQVVVVMGVSGAGKTTVGSLLAERLGWRFADADDFHSAENIAKMRGGIALDDRDRAAWLDAIAAQIECWLRAAQPAVVTCSALKRRYRDTLVAGRPDVRLVYLRAEPALIAERLARRHGHFMPASLLDSQFSALEEPTTHEPVLSVEASKSPSSIVDAIVAGMDHAGRDA